MTETEIENNVTADNSVAIKKDDTENKLFLSDEGYFDL